MDKNEYDKEAKAKWGNTEAFRQSEERVKKMGKEGLKKTAEENEKLTKEIAECMKIGVSAISEPAQKLFARHYEGLRAFYEPNFELYRGLAEMYVADARFKAHYEKTAEGLAEYMKEGMMFFSDKK